MSAEIQTLGMSEEQLREAVRRLCHFVPPEKNLVTSLHEFLVQHALAFLGTGSHTVAEIKDSLQRLFSMEFEEVEIIAETRRLSKAGALLPSTEGTWALDIKRYEELAKSVEGAKSFERQVIDNWQKEVRERHPTLSDNDLEVLEHDLRDYTAMVFARHGAECVALIYAGKTKADDFINTLEEGIVPSLPKRSPLVHDVRLMELPAFFKDASPERKRYIAELLDSTFILHMLHVDKNCSALVQTQTRGQTLYLDTNVLYRLLELQGPVLYRAAKCLAEISRQLGCVLAVSTRTVKEWQRSLENSMTWLKSHPPPPPELARIGVQYAAEQDFVTAYYLKYAEIQISIDDFFAMYQHLEDLLAEQGIEIKDTLCQEVQEAPELMEEISKLNGSLDYYGYYKAPPVAEHDAFHRLLIKKLREKEPRTWSEARFWFITCDTNLPRFDRFARKKPTEIPFCILADQWVQVARSLLPRTPDFDQAFADLLSSPYLRSYKGLPSDLALRITARIGQYRDHSPALAVKVLTDEYVIRALKETEDEGEQQLIIDGGIARAAEKFRQEKGEAEAQLQKVTTERETLKKERDKLESQLKEERLQRGQKEKGVATTHEDYENLTKRLESLERRYKWSIAAFVWILALIGIFAIPWGSLVHFSRFAAIAAMIFASIGALAFPLGRNKTWKMFELIAIICGVLSLIWTVVGG